MKWSYFRTNMHQPLRYVAFWLSWLNEFDKLIKLIVIQTLHGPVTAMTLPWSCGQWQGPLGDRSTHSGYNIDIYERSWRWCVSHAKLSSMDKISLNEKDCGFYYPLVHYKMNWNQTFPYGFHKISISSSVLGYHQLSTK